MLRTDIAELTNLVLARLKTDAAGAPVRALLGSGAESVIEAWQVRSVLAEQRRFPLVALAGGPIASSEAVQFPEYSWWLYDELAFGHTRLRPLVHTIGRAFDLEDSPLGMLSVHADIDAGDEFIDAIYNRAGRRIRLRLVC